MTPARPNDIWSIDDLELELRQLPGVRSAGFDDSDDVLVVQLHVSEPVDRADAPDQPVPVSASRIAARHSDRPVAVEIVRWRNAPGLGAPIAPPEGATADAEVEPTGVPQMREATRCRLLAVLAFPETDELEVHLVLAGQRTIGRAAASRGLLGTVEATVAALVALASGIAPTARWARELDAPGDDTALVAVSLDLTEGGEILHVYGVSAGTSAIDAAARATIDALNRRLTRRSD
jgi:hypothetical protein